VSPIVASSNVRGFPSDIHRRLVFSQPDVNRAPQEVVSRPGQIGDLDDKLWREDSRALGPRADRGDSSRRPIARKAETGEPEQHHRPGGGLQDARPRCNRFAGGLIVPVLQNFRAEGRHIAEVDPIWELELQPDVVAGYRVEDRGGRRERQELAIGANEYAGLIRNWRRNKRTHQAVAPPSTPDRS
jgi:hypothetical protein